MSDIHSAIRRLTWHAETMCGELLGGCRDYYEARDLAAASAERGVIARVLAPGGAHIATVGTVSRAGWPAGKRRKARAEP